MTHRQRYHTRDVLAVLGDKFHLTIFVQLLKLFGGYAHAQIDTGYLNLIGKTRTPHRHTKYHRALAERNAYRLKRHGDTHVKERLRCLFLNKMLVTHHPAGVSLIS